MQLLDNVVFTFFTIGPMLQSKSYGSFKFSVAARSILNDSRYHSRKRCRNIEKSHGRKTQWNTSRGKKFKFIKSVLQTGLKKIKSPVSFREKPIRQSRPNRDGMASRRSPTTSRRPSGRHPRSCPRPQTPARCCGTRSSGRARRAGIAGIWLRGPLERDLLHVVTK